MLATLAGVREKYGSVESYMTDACGLSAVEVAQIRRNMVVDGSEEKPLEWESHARIVQAAVAARAEP